MMNSLIELSINDFRAIKQAKIEINGITVVSGINGCGKSTLSKMLYYGINGANRLDSLIISHTNIRLQPYINVLEQIQNYLYMHSSHQYKRGILEFEWYFSDLSDVKDYLTKVKKILDLALDEFGNDKADSGSKKNISERLLLIFKTTLSKNEFQSFNDITDTLYLKIEEVLASAIKRKADRPYKILKDEIESVFESPLQKNTYIKEYGDAFVGESVSHIPLLHYIKKVAYIDTPMIIGMDTRRLPVNSYWTELNTLLKVKPQKNYRRSLNNIIKDQIIGGDVSYDEDFSFSGGFKYQRGDGKEFDLLDCATGIKSFAMLQLLIKNKFLDENTLLIIDEPEAHLHPQWIVEYANLIVQINKKLNVKFFIASHSTDMVSALKYISEKEKNAKNLKFYLAEDLDDNMSYTFRDLNRNIEPIFESFNKSMSKIELYGGY